MLDTETTPESASGIAKELESRGIQRYEPAPIDHVRSGMGRIESIRALMQGIPNNDYGLPQFIYRSDMIPDDFSELDQDNQAEILRVATVSINYLEGFPTFSDGTSMWSQMFFESDPAFTVFIGYLNLPDEFGIRRLEDLAGKENMPNRHELRDLFIGYYWESRARAYDLFRVAAAQKLRERRILSVQDTHFLESERILTRLYEFLKKPDLLEDLTPEAAVNMLDKLVKIQRISIGLPGHGLSGAGQDGSLPGSTPVEVTFKQIVLQGRDPSLESVDNKVNLDILLADPDTAALAQKLVVKAGQQKKVA